LLTDLTSTSAVGRIQLVEPFRKRVKTILLDNKYRLLGIATRWMVPRTFSKSIAEARTFCCFIGHGRSGGTLVGALLNAHPNIVMSNELNALRRIRIGMSEKALYRVIYVVSKRQALRGSLGGGGYSYSVPGQSQGSHKELLVVGDRKAGASAYEVITHPEILEQLDNIVRLRKRFIHVVRNPFDTIATTYHKTLPGDAQTARLHLEREMHNYFLRCDAVQKVESRFGAANVYFLHHEQLLAHPNQELEQLCGFLEVPIYQEYLVACASILMRTPHKTRTSVAWDSNWLTTVMRKMQNYHWLKRYSHAS
jgi:hypothetical protein